MTKSNLVKLMILNIVGLIITSMASAQTLNRFTNLTVCTDAGYYDIIQKGKTVHNIKASLNYLWGTETHSMDLIKGGKVENYNTTVNGQPSRKMEVTTENTQLVTVLTFVQKEGENFIRISAHISLKEPNINISIEDIKLFKTSFENTFLGAYGRKNCRFLSTWNDVWYPSGSVPMEGKNDNVEIKSLFAYHTAAVYSPAKREAITFQYQLPNIWKDAICEIEGQLTAQDYIGARLYFKQPLKSDYLMVSVGPNYTNAIANMHTVNQSRHEAIEAKDNFGWNSWESYHTKVTEADIVENMEQINAIPWLKKKIRYITIDDGWQKGFDWFQSNSKFPNGMDGMAKKIKEAGFIPGIWLAPFLSDKNGQTVKNHPEWLLQKNGKPYLDNGKYILDPTHPEARAYIATIFTHLYNLGYRYFKTDYLREPLLRAIPGRDVYDPNITCYNPDLGMAKGMRSAMESIRAAMGEESFWNACGTDIGSGAGLYDAARFGGDITPYWTRVPNQARSVINHLHLHGSYYLADPDFTIVKGTDTFFPEYLDIKSVSDKPYVVDAFEGGPCFNADDARTWSSFVILTGGIVNLTDRIKGLNETGLSILKTVIENAGGNAAVPMDIKSAIPGVLLRDEADRCYLGLINWSNDKTVTLSVTPDMAVPFPKSGVVRDLWTNKEVVIKNGKLSKDLLPHKSILLTWQKTENVIKSNVCVKRP